MAPLSASGRGLRRIFVISCNCLLTGLNHIKLPLIWGIHQKSPSTSRYPLHLGVPYLIVIQQIFQPVAKQQLTQSFANLASFDIR